MNLNKFEESRQKMSLKSQVMPDEFSDNAIKFQVIP